jgi:hypothetical protein
MPLNKQGPENTLLQILHLYPGPFLFSGKSPEIDTATGGFLSPPPFGSVFILLP